MGGVLIPSLGPVVRLVLAVLCAAAGLGAGTLDAVGNTLSHTDRTQVTTPFILANAGNEYASIGGGPIAYDAAGNLTLDEEGRQYSYDEENRLTLVRGAQGAGGAALASYVYDALGRRVQATIGSVTKRYIYAGDQVVEERDAANVLLRAHVHGAQYIDEKVASFTPGVEAEESAEFYLLDRNYTVIGVATPTGSVTGDLRRIDAGAWGDFTSGRKHDADGDGDIEVRDAMSLAVAMGDTSGPGVVIHDADATGTANGTVEANDFQGLDVCYSGVNVPATCFGAGSTGVVNGDFTLHGARTDVLPDGKVLIDLRNRVYDPRRARFLQRDPLGYVDGPNLYEAFGGNGLVNVDPFGEDGEWLVSKPFAWVASKSTGTWVETPVYWTAGLVDALGGSGVNFGVGVGIAAKELALIPVDAHGMQWEIYTVGAIRYEPKGALAKRFARGGSWTEVGQDSVELSGRGLRSGLTLRVYDLGEGVVNYARTGDDAQLSNTAGGVFFGTGLAIAGAKLPGGNPALSLSMRSARAPSGGALVGLGNTESGALVVGPGIGSEIGGVGIRIIGSDGVGGVGSRIVGPGLAMPVTSAASNRLGAFSVGQYDVIKSLKQPWLEAHHVGQKALMRHVVRNYNPTTGPAILVPKIGHTIKGPVGIVSRNTEGVHTSRSLIARDILELRRVYPQIPNASLRTLIDLNKRMYPEVRKAP